MYIGKTNNNWSVTSTWWEVFVHKICENIWRNCITCHSYDMMMFWLFPLYFEFQLLCAISLFVEILFKKHRKKTLHLLSLCLFRGSLKKYLLFLCSCIKRKLLPMLLPFSRSLLFQSFLLIQIPSIIAYEWHKISTIILQVR